MKHMIFLLFAVTGFSLTGCIEQKNSEEEQPEVDLLSPRPCDTLYFGESFNLTAKLTDNTGLGNISFDIHHNFGKHNHGAHETCSYDQDKQAINPYSESWIFSLPAEKNIYIFDKSITLPYRNMEHNTFDQGDYHFHIYVTDNEGYQVFTTRDVKLLYR